MPNPTVLRLWRRLYLLPSLAWALSGVFLVGTDCQLDLALRRQRADDFHRETSRVGRLLGSTRPVEAARYLDALFTYRLSGDRLQLVAPGQRLLADTDRDSSLWLERPGRAGLGVSHWSVVPTPSPPAQASAEPELRCEFAGRIPGAVEPLRVLWSRHAPRSPFGGPLQRALVLGWLGFGALLVWSGWRGVTRFERSVAGLRRLIRSINEDPAGRGTAAAGGEIGDGDPGDDDLDLAYELAGVRRRLRREVAALREESRQRDAINERMPEGLLAIDDRRRIILINAAARNLLGLAEPPPEGARLVEVVKVSELHRFVEQRLAGLEPPEVELDTEGGRRTLRVQATPLTGPEGTSRGLVLLLADTTAVRRLEQIRKDFVDNVSHELKTPLTTLRGYVETLLDGAHQDARTRVQFLHTMHLNAERMHRIVEDLLNLSRIESQGRQIERAPIDVGDLAARVLDERRPDAATREVRLTLRDECGPALYRGNSFMLERALSNLIDNAIKYGGQGKEVRLRVAREAGLLLLEVSDEGTGIPAAHLPRLFERFYRVDRGRSRELGGTGLGLAIVKHVAIAHGGEATVASEPGRGAVFTLRLPWIDG